MTDDLRARVLVAIDEQLVHAEAAAPGLFGIADRWPAALRFARGEVERHERGSYDGACVCCWKTSPCPAIQAAAAAFGVEP